MIEGYKNEAKCAPQKTTRKREHKVIILNADKLTDPTFNEGYIFENYVDTLLESLNDGYEIVHHKSDSNGNIVYVLMKTTWE